MKTNFTARHTDITPDIKQYCERRSKSIEKKLGYDVEFDIILSIEKYRHIAEVNVKTKGSTLNMVEETHDMRSSLDAVFDRLDRRIKRDKAKLRERRKNRIRETEIQSVPLEEEDQKRIIRSHHVSMKPMSPEEAVFQLESSRKEVFIFRMSDSEKWAVVYRRHDGHYGLIEPE